MIISYLIPILFILSSCKNESKQIDTWNKRIAENKSETKVISLENEMNTKKQIKVADTITNWQFYKDSELLFKVIFLTRTDLLLKLKRLTNMKT